jgi:L-iditol 2-dehydrogenase
MTMTDAALCEPLSVGLHAIEQAEVSAGDSVLIMGAGPIGRASLECARANGATDIVIVDIVDEKLRRARDQGANISINSDSESVIDTLRTTFDDGVDIGIEATGVKDAIETVPKTVAPGGLVVLMGLAPGQPVPFDTYRLVRRQIDIRSSYRFANTYPTCIDLLTNGVIDGKSMVDFHADLSEVADVFELATHPNVVKAMIDNK